MTLIFSEKFAINPQSAEGGGGGGSQPSLKHTVVVEPDFKSLNMEIKVEEE